MANNALDLLKGVLSKLNAQLSGDKERKESQDAFERSKIELQKSTANVQSSDVKLKKAEADHQTAQQLGQGIDKAAAKLKEAAASLADAKLREVEATDKRNAAQEKLTRGQGLGHQLEKMSGFAKDFGLEEIGKALKTQANYARLDAGDPTALKDILVDVASRLKGMISETGKAATSTNVLGAGSHGLNAAGEGAGAIPVIGMVAGPVLKFGGALVGAAESLRQWGWKLHEVNMQFAEYSAAMASVKARQQIRDIQYAQKMGAATAESSDRLAEANSNLRDALAPEQAAWSNLQNKLTAFPLEKLTEAIKALHEKLGIKELPEPPENWGDMGEWMKDTANDWAKEHAKPPRFPAGGLPRRTT